MSVADVTCVISATRERIDFAEGKGNGGVLSPGKMIAMRMLSR